MTQRLRILVTGASGWTGSHLCLLGLSKGAHVFGFSRSGHFPAGVQGRAGDLTQPGEFEKWLAECRPERIFHLAALTHAKGPPTEESLRQNNVEATRVLLQSSQKYAPGSSVLVAGSSGIYGQPDDDASLINEEAEIRPLSAYARSKAEQDCLTASFYKEHGLHTVRARTFNQTGPGEPEGLVCAALARQIARIEAGLQNPVLKVLSLRPRRDFCDVRDVAAGYWEALEHGRAGEAYNVCSGLNRGIEEITDVLLHLSCVRNIRVEETDSEPASGSIFSQTGNPSKLKACSGWRPRFSLEKSLGDLLTEWRSKVGRLE